MRYEYICHVEKMLKRILPAACFQFLNRQVKSKTNPVANYSEHRGVLASVKLLFNIKFLCHNPFSPID